MSGPTPLAGVRVLVPRSRSQASALSARVRALGGEPVEAPTIEIASGDLGALRRHLDELRAGGYTAICLTSPNGVDALVDAGARPEHLAATTVACVGPGTAGRLRERLDVDADLLPERATTASLGAAFPPGRGRVLLPRADLATAALPDRLRDLGYEPVHVVAYRTLRPESLPPGVLDDLEAGRIDLVALASSSTARNFVALTEGRSRRAAIVSIGPVTSATCRELGLEVAAEATEHTIDGLVEALVQAAHDPG